MATSIKWGNELNVNTIVTNRQVEPAITALANGHYVVSWTDEGSHTLGDASGSAVHAQIFSADGIKVGDEFLVNAGNTADYQAMPIMSALSGGGFVALWSYKHGQTDMVGQVFNADGSPSGATFVVDTDLGQLNFASVATLTSGRFAVTWRNRDDDHLYVKVYNPNGTPFSASIIVDDAGVAIQPSITELANGRFVIAWQENQDVRAQIYDANLGTSGPQFIVNSTVAGLQGDAVTTMLADGRFVVAWESGFSDVRGQIFHPDGSRSGTEFLLDAGAYSPQVTALPDGRFVAVWEDRSDHEVSGQLFNADGTKSGAEFLVNTDTAYFQGAPDIATLADGRFVVTWRGEDSDDAGIRSQIFDPRESGVVVDGTTLNDEFMGTNFNDTLKGAGGADKLSGFGGDDLLIGGAGADTLWGGGGSDTASYIGSSSAVMIDLADSMNNGGDAQGDVLHSIENLIGSDFADTFVGNGRDNTLEGGAGADTLIGGHNGDGIDTASYRTSTSGVNVSLLTGFGFGGDAQGDYLAYIDNLVGSKYADTLTGDSGANAIDGGLGDDTAVFSHNFNDYTVMDVGGKIVVAGPDGTDTLTSIEHLQFANTTITPVDDGSPLFDALYYLSRNPDVFQAGMDPLFHFYTVGWQEGRDPNAFFDTSGYLAVNKDVAASGMNPLEHYHQSGRHEGRDPSANFDTTLYLINNPDVAAAGMDPLAHYLQFGYAEGRAAYQAIGQNIVGGFDAQYYLMHNPDVAAAGLDPLFHFNVVGWQEGRDPNAWFDADGYLAHYTDVKAAGINPLAHYEAVGWKEGRDASTWFDTAGYLAANADVAAAGYNPLDHFLQHGIYEGRQAVNDGMWG